MPTVSIAIGVVLVLLGLFAYFGTAGQSVTALIPAFFGAPLAVLGALGRDERRLKTTMHIAAVLMLLGFLGSVRGIPGAVTLLSGGTVERPAAAVVQTVMALLCAVFLALAVRSFVDARRSR